MVKGLSAYREIHEIHSILYLSRESRSIEKEMENEVYEL
jgi:hypothetical protein